MHKFLWVWQAWEACSQELPTSSRKLEKHTHPGVMIASNPWPSIFHKHGCCMPFCLCDIHSHSDDQKLQGLLERLSRGFYGYEDQFKTFFLCSVDQFCGQIWESRTKKCLGTLFTYDKQFTGFMNLTREQRVDQNTDHPGRQKQFRNIVQVNIQTLTGKSIHTMAGMVEGKLQRAKSWSRYSLGL